MVRRRVRCRSSSCPSAPDDQVQGPPEPVADRGEGQHRDLPGDQLDRQGQAVEVLQDLDEWSGVERGQLVGAVPAPGVLEERAHARLPLEGGEVVGVPRRRQRLEADDVLTAGVQRHPGGDQHPDSRRVPVDGVDQAAAGLGHVLGVVEDQEQRGVGQGGCDVEGGGRLRGDEPQAERRDHGLHDPGGVLDRGEVHHDGVDLVQLGERGGDLEREPGLADAAGTGERDHPVAGEQAQHLVVLLLASDQGSGRAGHGPARRPGRRSVARGELARGDLLLETAQGRARVQAGLRGQAAAVRRPGGHRLRRAALPRERLHEQEHAALAQRVGRDRGAGVRHGRAVADRDAGPHHLVVQPQPQLVERHRLDVEVRVAAELLERRPAPELRAPRAPDRARGRAGGAAARRPRPGPRWRRARPRSSSRT